MFNSTSDVRRQITCDMDTWQALTLLGLETGRSVDDLVEEAIAGLLRKNLRPVGLLNALQQSVRMQPANDRQDLDCCG